MRLLDPEELWNTNEITLVSTRSPAEAILKILDNVGNNHVNVSSAYQDLFIDEYCVNPKKILGATILDLFSFKGALPDVFPKNTILIWNDSNMIPEKLKRLITKSVRYRTGELERN
jgi:hypothetical protein